jgi:trans-aconitate methyltransferase
MISIFKNSIQVLILFLSIVFTPLSLMANGIEESNIYHNNSTPQWRIAMETIELASWKGTEHVLDIGCGDGKITAFLFKKVSLGSILGIDTSQAMIDFATIEYPQLSFHKLDALEMTFEEQFDRVVSFSTLHWIVDQKKVLKAIYRALVPGGDVCLQTYGTGVMNVTVIADALVKTEKWSSFFPSYTQQRVFFTEEEYRALLQSVGFEQVRIFGSWNDTPFTDREGLIAFAKPLLNFIRHLPEELQYEFVEEVVDKIISIAGSSEDGLIHYKLFNIQAFGVKKK